MIELCIVSTANGGGGILSCRGSVMGEVLMPPPRLPADWRERGVRFGLSKIEQ